MFQNVILDQTRDGSPARTRFYSCIHFVADECHPAVFYVNKTWSHQEIIEMAGVNPERVLKFQKDFLAAHDILPEIKYSGKTPRLVYLRSADWEEHVDEASIPIQVPAREFILSEYEFVNKAFLQDKGVNATTVVLSLAAVGLDLMLPNVNFSQVTNEEIEKLKEMFAEERAAYLSVLSEMSREAFDRFSASDHRELISWAENTVMFSLVPMARSIENAIRKAPKRTLMSAGASFWKEGVPAIGSAYFSGGTSAAAKEACVKIFEAVTSAIQGDPSRRDPPEYSYAMKISRKLGG